MSICSLESAGMNIVWELTAIHNKSSTIQNLLCYTIGMRKSTSRYSPVMVTPPKGILKCWSNERNLTSKEYLEMIVYHFFPWEGCIG